MQQHGVVEMCGRRPFRHRPWGGGDGAGPGCPNVDGARVGGLVCLGPARRAAWFVCARAQIECKHPSGRVKEKQNERAKERC